MLLHFSSLSRLIDHDRALKEKRMDADYSGHGGLKLFFDSPRRKKEIMFMWLTFCVLSKYPVDHCGSKQIAFQNREVGALSMSYHITLKIILFTFFTKAFSYRLNRHTYIFL